MKLFIESLFYPELQYNIEIRSIGNIIELDCVSFFVPLIKRNGIASMFSVLYRGLNASLLLANLKITFIEI